MTLAATACDRALPRDVWPDSTLPLVFEGYDFIGNRRRRFGADAFACRLLFRSAVCIGGPDAAELFYDTNRFRRGGVVPRRVLKTLLGEGGIHGLDGALHVGRKAMFLAFMGPHTLGPIRELMQRHWRQGIAEWRGKTVAVFERTQFILFQALAEFAGIPLAPEEVSTRTADLAAMVDGFGAWVRATGGHASPVCGASDGRVISFAVSAVAASRLILKRQRLSSPIIANGMASRWTKPPPL